MASIILQEIPQFIRFTLPIYLLLSKRLDNFTAFLDNLLGFCTDPDLKEL